MADGQSQPQLYVGETEEVRDRLNTHYASKDFWQQAIIFTTRGNPLNKAVIRYLEARLLELARDNKRCLLNNSGISKIPRLSEPDKAEAEGYLAEMLSLLPVIGINAFERAQAPTSSQRIYHFKGKGWKATGYETSNGFAVQEGSLARTDVAGSSISKGSRNKRESLIETGVLAKEDDGYRFTVDHEFSSPSQAGEVCAGRSSNGRVDWKDSNRVMLKENQQREAGA